MRRSLDEIGLSNETDKASTHHDYLGWYEEALRDRRDQSFTLFEIGVFRGGSLATWGEFFERATIVGMDINPHVSQTGLRPNTHVRIGDASKLEFLDEVVAEFGHPHVVVDDGSHFWHHQIEALRYLWPRIAPGGLFIMEDIHTSFPALAANFRGYSAITCFDYLNKLNRWVVGNRFMGDEIPDDGFIATYWSSVRSMHFYRGTCIIHKRS